MHLATEASARTVGSSLSATRADIAVLYLARGGLGGLTLVRKFIQSLHTSPAGISNDLFFVAKNWSVDEQGQLERLASSVSARIIWLPDDGFDWGAYFRVVPKLAHKWVCLLNTHSQPRCEGWLEKLYAAASLPGVGIAGATGSWESPRSFSLGAKTGVIGTLRDTAHQFRHFRHLSHFQRFPNPTVRSTGFVIDRQLFAEFVRDREIPMTKHAAHRLEGAKTGLSAFIKARKLELIVVGADGLSYRPQEWPMSRTFRSGDQENLLIEDNRTNDFANGTFAVRQYLAKLAWNDSTIGTSTDMGKIPAPKAGAQ